MLAVSAPALALTLVCALGFAASDYFRKAATEHIGPTLLLTVFVGGQVPLLGIWVMLTDGLQVSAAYWPYGLAAAAAGLIANLFFILAMRASALSLTIPVLGLIPVLTTAFGAIALDEIPSGQQLAGIALAVAGLITLYMPEGTRNPLRVVARFATDTGARYMLAVTVMWSATAPLEKIGVQFSTAASHGFIQVCIITAVLLAYLIVRRGHTLAVAKAALTPAALASVTAGIAYGCQLVAYQLTLVGVVESLKRVIGLVSALLLGRMLLNETLNRTKIAGIMLMAVGVPLIILPPLV